MKREVACALTLVGLFCGACASTDNATTSGGSPVPVSPSLVTTARDVSGVWQGALDSSQGVWIDIDQSGSSLSGHGALVVNGGLVATEVSGTIDPNGNAELSLVPHDDDNTSQGSQLSVAFVSDTSVQASLSNTTDPQGVGLTLSRPPTSSSQLGLKVWDNSLTPLQSGLNEVYHLDLTTSSGKTFSIDVKLAGSTLWEFVGSWSSTGGDSFWDGARQGRAAAGNGITGVQSYITLKDKYAFTPYSTLWFNRITNGQAGGTSSISGTSRGDGDKVTGTATLVTP